MSASKLIAVYPSLVWANGQIVPSPCVSVCQMHTSSGLCDGCFRTIDEIAGWSRMDNGDKRVVWDRIVQRAQLETGV